MQGVVIRNYSEDMQAAWDAYVTQNPASSIYHLSAWKTVIETAFGHETAYLYAADAQGNLCGVLPLVRLKSPLFGDFVVSIPYFNYGGALGEHAEVESALMLQASQRFAGTTVGHIEWRDVVRRASYSVREDKAAMILALPETEEVLWSQLGTKLRAQIKKPQKEAPMLLIGGEEYLEDFYAVFATNMRDLGTPVYAKSFFAIILRQLGKKARLVVIRHQGKPVSAAFLLGFRGQLEIPWASTVREANSLSMNMLLYWEVLRFAIREGYHQFDFGRSTRDAGTYKFKAQWGAQPKQLYWHYWLPEGKELPRLNPDNPKFKLAIAIWQRLPLWLTKLIGPPVVKYLP
ncbi:Protein of unknown function, DUF482 [gamma proteobacterium HdN1]|nr:Protein of unknown function, DUF482 [gamma proteobacterium HdN1]